MLKKISCDEIGYLTDTLFEFVNLLSILAYLEIILTLPFLKQTSKSPLHLPDIHIDLT